MFMVFIPFGSLRINRRIHDIDVAADQLSDIDNQLGQGWFFAPLVFNGNVVLVNSRMEKRSQRLDPRSKMREAKGQGDKDAMLSPYLDTAVGRGVGA